MQGDFCTSLVAKTTTSKAAVHLCTLACGRSLEEARRRRKPEELGSKKYSLGKQKGICVRMQPLEASYL